MRKLSATLLAALVVLTCLASRPVSAQFGARKAPRFGPGYRPNLSPYLNLIRGGNPAANYYLGVRPEIERRQDEMLFRQNIDELETKTGDLRQRTRLAREDIDILKKTPPNLKRPIIFNNTGPFYSNTGAYYPKTPNLPRR